MRISDWSSDVCSSDLGLRLEEAVGTVSPHGVHGVAFQQSYDAAIAHRVAPVIPYQLVLVIGNIETYAIVERVDAVAPPDVELPAPARSEEHRVGKEWVITY